MFEVFNYRGLMSLEDLKRRLIEDKRIHSKYTKRITPMDEHQLKEFLFLGEYHEEVFEGVASVFTAIVTKDTRKLFKHIIGISLGPQNIIRVMIDTLKNIDIYKDSEKFYRHLFIFKVKYEAKFQNLLFDFGCNPRADKLDLLELLRQLME